MAMLAANRATHTSSVRRKKTAVTGSQRHKDASMGGVSDLFTSKLHDSSYPDGGPGDSPYGTPFEHDSGTSRNGRGEDGVAV